MRSIIIITIVATLCYAAELPLHVPGYRVWSKMSREAAAPTCSTAVGLQCAADCATLMTCTGTNTPVFSQTCKSANAKTPYCVANVCTATPDAADKNCQGSFTCTSEGVFPDATDCTQYHYCPAVSGTAELFKCPQNYVFNTKTATCTSKSSLACNTIDCSKTTNAMVVYKANPAYYAFCLSGQNGQIIMYKCFDDQNEIYDTTINACRFNCKSTGNFVDRTNCNGYITCAYISGKWVATPQACPPKYYFKTNSCVPATATPCVSELTKPAAAGGGDPPGAGGDPPGAGGDPPGAGGDPPGAGGDPQGGGGF